jgi:outer membrane protein TolC
MIKSEFKLLMLILTLILFLGNVKAQQKMSLTVDQAVEVGLKNSKLLHSSLMKVKSAEAKVKEIDAGRLPSLKLTAAYRRLSSINPFAISFMGANYTISPSLLDAYTSQLTLMQPLFTGFRLSAGSDMAEQSAMATSQDYSKDQSDLVFNIRNSYWSLFKAMQMKTVMDETVNQAKAHINDAKNLLNAGMLTQNDILKLEVQLSDVEFKQVDAENAVKLANVALNSVLNIPLETEIEINSTPDAVPSEYDGIDRLVNDAIDKRPELKSAGYRVKASEANVTMAQSSWYPQISVVGDYYYSNPNSRIFPAHNKFDGTWDVGVNLSVNIWDWFTTAHQTEQAQAQLTQSMDALSIIKDNITLEVTQNYLNFSQAKKKIDISQLGEQQAKENLRVTEDKFKSGMALSSDVVDAETAYSTAKINYTNSIVDYELAKARLDKSIGK